MKTNLWILTALLLGGIVACATQQVDLIRLEPRQPQPPMADMGRLAKAITAELERAHYAPPKVNDEFSEKVFDLYIRICDPMKILLTDSDVESFAKYRCFIDNELKTDRLSFPWVVSELVSRRAEELVLFAQNYLQHPVDLDGDDSVILGERASDSMAQRQLWEGFIKNEVMRVRIMRKLANVKDLPIDNLRKESPYMAKFSETERVMLRVKQMTYPYRFPPQRAAAEKLFTAVALICDPHGMYSAPKDFERMLTHLKLTFAGIGIQYNMEDGFCQVMDIVKNGPVATQKVNLKPGDVILSVAEENGSTTPITGMPANNVSDLIRGPKGSKVVFEVADIDSPNVIKMVSVVRDDIVTEEARSSVTRQTIQTPQGKKSIAVVRLPMFYQRPSGKNGERRGCSDEIRTQLLASEAKDGSIDGIVLDLRNNGGGLLDEAVNMVGLFVPKGPAVQIRMRNHITIMTTSDTEPTFTQPLAVLMNKRSASASEIVSGALKDYGRAVIVGDEQTFGKGTVQQLIDLSPQAPKMGLPVPAGGIHLTIAKFYRINGETTQMNGVPADVVLPSDLNNSNEGERAMPGALKFDTIPAAKYQRVSMDVAPHLKALKEDSLKRVKAHQKLAAIMKKPKADSTPRQLFDFPKQTLILNEDKSFEKILVDLEKRRADKLAAEATQTDSAQTKGMGIAEAKSDSSYKYVNDMYLDETLQILGDWIERRK